MIYAQEKKKQKLHLAYQIGDRLTNPVCGRTVEKYRMTINVPMGEACKNCLNRLKSKSFNEKEFLKPYFI